MRGVAWIMDRSFPVPYTHLDVYKRQGDTSLACSVETQAQIDQQVVDLVKKHHQKAYALLREHRQKLDEIAQYLHEKETITGEEFMELLHA